MSDASLASVQGSMFVFADGSVLTAPSCFAVFPAGDGDPAITLILDRYGFLRTYALPHGIRRSQLRDVVMFMLTAWSKHKNEGRPVLTQGAGNMLAFSDGTIHAEPGLLVAPLKGLPALTLRAGTATLQPLYLGADRDCALACAEFALSLACTEKEQANDA